MPDSFRVGHNRLQMISVRAKIGRPREVILVVCSATVWCKKSRRVYRESFPANGGFTLVPRGQTVFAPRAENGLGNDVTSFCSGYPRNFWEINEARKGVNIVVCMPMVSPSYAITT